MFSRPALLLTVALAAVSVAPTTAASAGVVTPAIVGGTTVGAGQLPSLAFVDGQFADGSGESCSGTVVAPRLVLTAAHCAQDLTTGARYPAQDLQVITGAVNVGGTAGQTSTVSRVLIDPGFAPPSQDDDAALLVLASPTRAPAIALATAEPSGGTAATVAGWGETSGSAQDAPGLLREAPADVLDQDECADAWGDLFDADSELCTLDTPTLSAGACRGDSGGPLLGDQNGTTVELGVAIFVATGCATDAPDVYTRADAIAPWVNAEIAALAATTPRSGLTAGVTPASAPDPVATTSTASPLLHALNYAASAGRRGLAAVRRGSTGVGRRPSGRSAR